MAFDVIVNKAGSSEVGGAAYLVEEEKREQLKRWMGRREEEQPRDM